MGQKGHAAMNHWTHLGQDGQAMTEYVLLSVMVVIFANVQWIDGGWTSSIQKFLHEFMIIITLPCA